MKIELCDRCEGEGTIAVYDEMEREWTRKTCSKCKGTGRLWTREYKLQIPFDGTSGWSEEKEQLQFYSIDKQITALINSIKTR